MIDFLAEHVLAEATGLSSPPAWGLPIVCVVVGFSVARIIRRRKRGSSVSRRPPVRPKHPVVSPPRSNGLLNASLIGVVRHNIGSSPREFSYPLTRYLHVPAPKWLKNRPKDQLNEIYRSQNRLRRDGEVVWASVVQANSLLFKPGPEDHPASVIWSVDPYFDTHRESLQKIGPLLYTLKGLQPADPGLAEFAKVLTDERIRAPRLKVPLELANGRVVYHSSLMMTRKHLPQGYLTGNVLPVLADPNPTGLLLLVPAAYWPQILLDEWDR